MTVYFHGFDDWSDVQIAFEMDRKKPTQVIIAEYDNRDYDAHAFVLYRQGRHYFEVNGGHCSCYGLEGQWEPEGPYTKTVLRKMLERTTGGPTHRHRDAITAALAA